MGKCGSNLRIVERTIVREVAVRREVVVWNYLDFEHLVHVHSGYVKAELIYEDERVALEHLTLKVPYFPFLHSRSVHFIVKKLPEEILAWNIGLFSLPSATRIQMEALSPQSTRVTVTYRFALTGLRQLLAPVLPFLIDRWNERVWREDLPLKLRREEVLQRGFAETTPPASIRKSLVYPYPHGPLSRLLQDWISR